MKLIERGTVLEGSTKHNIVTAFPFYCITQTYPHIFISLFLEIFLE